VAILLRDFQGGGAERAMINIANGLVSRSVDVDMVVFSQEGSFHHYLDSRVRLVCLDTPVSGLATFMAILPMRRYFLSTRVRHVLTTLEAPTIVAFFCCMLMSKPPQLTIRVATTFGKEKRTGIRNFLIRSVYSRHRGIFVTNSKGSMENLSESLAISPERISVIYNGVDLNLIQQMAKAPTVDIGLSEHDKYILNIGRLTYAKQQDLLIKSFARLKDRSLKLVILGEGPLREELQALVENLELQDRVLMPGFVDNPYAFLRRAELFVLSSCYEGMPTVLIEAMACGCSVVSTNCPSGPSEILDGCEWTQLVPVNDEQALAMEMETQLQKPVDQNLLLKRAHDFTVDVMAQKYRQLLLGATE
jgi:glycosyltransferase involved in cell wall biosynthesis